MTINPSNTYTDIKRLLSAYPHFCYYQKVVKKQKLYILVVFSSIHEAQAKHYSGRKYSRENPEINTRRYIQEQEPCHGICCQKITKREV